MDPLLHTEIPIVFAQDFELQQALPSWERRGLSPYGQCVRADPRLDGTNGFFVALFSRKKVTAVSDERAFFKN